MTGQYKTIREWSLLQIPQNNMAALKKKKSLAIVKIESKLTSRSCSRFLTVFWVYYIPSLYIKHLATHEISLRPPYHFLSTQNVVQLQPVA